MTDLSPSDVVREVITLMRQQRWSEVPQWIEPEALDGVWGDLVEVARAEQHLKMTVEEYRACEPDMPLEVAQWHVDEMNNQVGKSFVISGVKSLEELKRMTPAEVMARTLEDRDGRSMHQRQIAAQMGRITSLDVESPPLERSVIGEVISGEHAFVVVQTRSPVNMFVDASLTFLRRTAVGWRLLPQGPMFGTYSFHFGEIFPNESWPLLPSVSQIDWVKRRFDHQLSPNHFPAILDRFRAGPSRIANLGWLSRTIRTAKPDGKWSIQEHVGHLLDLEELGEQRLADFIARVPVLSAADMTNRKTDEANHNDADWWELLLRFRDTRRSLCDKLKALPPEVVAHVAEHPRLKRPMNVAEWVFFMCEHDDHHFFRIRELYSQAAGPLFTS